MMKTEHDGEWLNFKDSEGEVKKYLYFEKDLSSYTFGFDTYYNDTLNLEELKLFSEFLSEHVKNEENNS